MCEILSVSEYNFSDIVLQNDSPVLVEFGATWCQPCKQVEKIFKQMLSEEWKSKLQIFHVDIDENLNLAMDYQIMSVPTVLLIVGGEIKERLTGAQPRQRYNQKISKYL